MKYGNRPTTKTILRSPFVLAGALVLIVFLARAAWSIRIKALASATKLEQAQAELSKLKVHEHDLSDQVNYLSSASGIEAELRTKYRAVKNGESVVVILDGSQTAIVADAVSTTTAAKAATSWWRWFSEFLGL